MPFFFPFAIRVDLLSVLVLGRHVLSGEQKSLQTSSSFWVESIAARKAPANQSVRDLDEARGVDSRIARDRLLHSR